MAVPENILLIRLKSIGDIIFTLPAVHAVRENFPEAKLHFLVSKEHAPILRGFSDVDEIIPLDRAMFRSKNPFAIGSSAFRLARGLRKKNFSHVMDFQGYGETAWLSWMSGAPERWGGLDHYLRAWAYTRTVWREKKIQPVERNLSLLRQCGLQIGEVRNEFILPADALDEARQFFAAQNVDAAKPVLFIQPFTSSPHKNWPLEKFLELARHFQREGAQIIFGGGPSERAALEPARQSGFPVSAGVSLLATAGLMNLSTLILGGDTGLSHLAVAMGKPVVMLMISAEAGRTYPLGHADWAITPSAGEKISEIQTEAVIEACARAFADCETQNVEIKSSRP